MTLDQQFYANPYAGYAYAYPHKTAYRPFASPFPLINIWKKEDQQNLFLYVHIPFCEMRCGFCNLFTTTNPKDDVVDLYLAQLEIETQEISKVLKTDHLFVRGAFGGGTPSILTPEQLERLFKTLNSNLNLATSIPLSFEVSPATVTTEKLNTLKNNDIQRISIGIQSFIESELKTIGRPQKQKQVEDTLRRIQSFQFKIFNIDLIYGAENQTPESFKQSIDQALGFGANEIYLYPLYVRPLTGLDRLGRKADNRLELYRVGRTYLLNNGFEQISMRLFRKHEYSKSSLEYCCQEDGMVGLGVGARSYTSNIHYSSEYAVERTAVKDIIDHYLTKQPSDFQNAVYGFQLNHFEQCHRYIIKSLLRAKGLNMENYEHRFQASALENHPELLELCEHNLAQLDRNSLVLNSKGIELSDAIGPWLFSKAAKEKMDCFQLK